ncbi:transketolase subunit B [Coriobacterium glomerans PW2]|uniref:Transketolase subunit B n=1 Tax=Coriobacterium glomerans (strain ATCC 49209 / DSM 20642 / JCM 10262 / PW2) TaxID=700015 RepID=F2NBM1_CORGP|nr:transketolase C-terminal domain-containing protein [Coriobacterium glomerans]AEB06757.1 transketolase subunit B [Coriobacterium glomerans PW2]
MAKATRAAFGATLVKLVDEGLDIMAVDADLAGSTTTAKLGAAYPDRLVDVGIAEQNMIGVAAGLSLTGRTVFTGSFAVFGAGRCYEQIRNTVCDSGLNVKVCPTHAGITVGADGATHQMLEDIALMRALPGMRVLVPADFASAAAAIRLAAETPGPFYIRLGREPLPEIYEEGFACTESCARVLREGGDLSIMACGVEVAQALGAAEVLESEGISAEVVDIMSVKPLDEKTVLASAAKCGRVLTVEEHSIYGGMGSAVSELLSQEHPVVVSRVGMTTFGQSGDATELLAHFGLDAAGIVDRAHQLLDR